MPAHVRDNGPTAHGSVRDRVSCPRCVRPVPDAENSEGKALTDGIAAIVNTEIITVSELQTEMGDEFFRLKARYEGDELKERLSQNVLKS